MPTIHIRLVGGPAAFPQEQRDRTVTPESLEELDDRVRVRFLAGWEHFEYTGDESADPADGTVVRCYEWIYRTHIAE
ncbi:hypothetical protein QFZ82_007930 [Streptomyces sp. V4I23]|uniref:DUF5988 family protein n=1 Tax=Streptomyces sp. V4I23 TaxID=3042282 RepID=UPI00277E8D9D|nr:DUF5988 family protein [Streptomyces sp. V4I23]MDQ1005750.1 hypothetical protein [Streptomyces sp. V4I23]MDQ1006000.1 hypothetical protein [Streptomyces sp. V4I23]MDQ1013362.1 hypothetical protein [Streptomyces sp. V4I23]